MSDAIVHKAIADAVGQAYESWAAEHPSLAAVIDRISLTDRAVESLRQSAEYRQAVSDYHRGLNELTLLNQLVELAGPVVQRILGV